MAKANDGWERQYSGLDVVPVVECKRMTVFCSDSNCQNSIDITFPSTLSKRECREQMAWILYGQWWHPLSNDVKRIYCREHHPEKEEISKIPRVPMKPPS